MTLMGNITVTTTVKVAGTDAKVLADSATFHLSCGENGCVSNCCTKSAPIVLNPYEIALICRETGMSYEDLLDIVDTGRARGFPLVMLPRYPACHFFTGKGCGIYGARPLACRLFPLGRVFDGGTSYIVHPGVNACGGIASAPSRTVGDYLRSQDVDAQIRMADRWIEFVSALERFPLDDAPVTSVAFHMLVYSPDTPAAPGSIDPSLSHEERFVLRLETAASHLPRFLRLKK
jgi:Fe-S-cluster containining protein